MITGSTRGIGFALAAGLAQAGASILLNGRNLDGLRTAQEKLASAGIKSHIMQADVSDPEQITEVLIGRG